MLCDMPHSPKPIGAQTQQLSMGEVRKGLFHLYYTGKPFSLF